MKKSTTILMLIMLFALIVTLHNVLHAQKQEQHDPVAADEMEMQHHASMSFLSGVLMRIAQ